MRAILLLLMLTGCVLATDDDHARLRRSNFPCGRSFTPCQRAAFGVTSNSIVDPIDQDQLESFQASPAKETITRDLTRIATAKAVRDAAQDAKESVDRLFNSTERLMHRTTTVQDFPSSVLAWADITKMDKYAKDITYSSLISISTTQRLKNLGLSSEQVAFGLPEMPVTDTAVQAVCPVNLIVDCIPGKYRTYSGHCNNVNNPLKGAVYEPFQRLQKPDYADDVSLPRATHKGERLPSPRDVSVQLFTPPPGGHTECSLMVAQWAQFVHSDLSHIGSNRLFVGEQQVMLPCCDANARHPECYPISISESDPVFKGASTCMTYSRTYTAPRENCTMGVREQGNLASSFLDASHIYGSTTERANKLRSFRNGLLLVRAQSGRGDLPPSSEEVSEHCASVSSLQPCFLTGSDDTNLLPTTAALHTIWVRQHNNVAQKLKELNPQWDDERLYQETRRIVTAQIQHITYSEFLPLVIGKESAVQHGLRLRNHAFDSDYDLKVDPSTLNEYASTVGQFFFTLLPDRLAQYAETGDRVHEKVLNGFYNDPSQLYLRGRLDATLRFLLRDPIRKPGLHMSPELRDRFLKGSLEHGLDLAALIIQMGRDHGISSYTKWRSYCGLSEPRTFDDLRNIVLDSVDIQQLQKLYDDIKDVDLFVLGLAEKPKRGALVGPVFACIMGKQFQKTRRGDRFWYENFFYPSAFTEEQLNEIRKISLARVICENTDNIGKIQQNVFMLADNYGNCPVDCNTTIFEDTNLKPWLDQEPKLKLPITKQTLEKAVRLGLEQYRRLQQAETGRINRSGGPTNRDVSSALSAHASLMAPKKESLDIARTAAVLRETTKVLLRGDGLDESEKLPAELDVSTLQRLLPEVDVTRIIGNISDFLGPESPNRDECLPQPLPCDHTSKFRTYSGWCNNLRFPNYGNAFGPLRRLLDPAYDDGFDSPRQKARNGRPLPSARAISNAVHKDAPDFHVKFTHMIMQFGQILDHDMTHSPIARGPNNAILNCSRCDSYDTLSIHCYPIPIERGDPHFPAFHSDGTPRCMPFARSLLGQVTLGYRNQLNQLTSFLDASFIYGSTECEANALRLFNQGRMNFTDLGFNKEALPQGSQERDCRSRSRHPCFNAGDERSNEQPGLTVLHTVLLREHNRIATALNRINNFWPDEKVFQETRRIMIAKHQHIIYNEWLPVVLGCETMARYDLTPKKSGYYNGYDDHCDAAITQEMSTSAFRFGHTLIRSMFPRMNSNFNTSATPVDLKATFNNASILYDVAGGHMESILMGLLGTQSMAYDRHIVDAVRNHLFQRPGGPLTGLDLPAINIQRGRDHAVQPYNAYREMCGMSRARSFEDLRDVMDDSTIRALKSVYSHVDDIDLFPGMMSERPIKGALVGPMLACVIAEQFQRLKRCDRFYYENNDPATRFTPDQLAEIRRTTMSKLICENSEYGRKIQPNAFLMPDDLTNAPVQCKDLPDVDVYEWLDRQFCVVDHRVINLGKTKRITPCITCTCTAEGPECHSVVVGQCENLLNEYLFSEIMEMDQLPEKKQSTANSSRKTAVFGTRTRFFIIALLLLCLASVWCNILTFNFAVICMHPHRSNNGSYTSLTLDLMKDAAEHDQTAPHVISFWGGEIIWYSATDKSLLVAVVAAGALLSNLLSVSLINHYGIRTVFGGLGLLSALSTILIPSAARLGLPYFLFMRFLQGVAFSGNFAVIGSFSNKWTYHKQNGMFVSALVAHLQLSPALTMPISSMLCTNFGWPSVYYSHGVVSLVIFVFFIFIYRNSPGKHPLVGDIELHKISLGKEPVSKQEQRQIPYNAILRSWPVWAIWVAGIGAFSTVNMMSLFAPTYLHAVLGFEVKHTGISAAIPPLLQFLIKLSCGIISDKMRSIPETKKLKYFNSLAFCGSALCLTILGFCNPEHQLLCLALLAGSTGFLGLTTGGFFKAAPLIARHYANVVMGNISFAITITMLLIPFLVGGLAYDNTPEQWREVFLTIAVIMFVTNGFFVIFGSGTQQTWAVSQSRMQSQTDVLKTKVAPENIKY